MSSESRYVILLSVLLFSPFAGILIHPAGMVLGSSYCDGPASFYPMMNFATRCWLSGEIPLWSPHVMLGFPFHGEGEGGIFHPFSLLFLVFSTGVAINTVAALTVVLSGLFFFRYLRVLGLGNQASFCGALTWSFSSIIISRIHAGHLSMLCALCFMPLTILLWETYRKNGDLLSLGGIALAYACQILAGHPQSVYIFSLFFFFYVMIPLILTIGLSKLFLREAKMVAALTLAISIGIGIGAIQILPMLAFAGESVRRETSMEFAGVFSFPPENIVTLVCPKFFGVSLAPEPGQYWGRNYPWEMWMYIGILPLVLSFAGLVAAPRKQRITLGGCALLFFLIALGSHTPLFSIPWRFLPFFSLFRGPSKFSIVTVFCLAVLSAYAFDSLFRGLRVPLLDTSSFNDREGQLCGEKEASAIRRRATLAGLFCSILAVAAISVFVFLYNPAHAQLGGRWHKFMQWVFDQGETYAEVKFDDSTTIARAGAYTARQLTLSIVLASLTICAMILSALRKASKILFPFCVVLILVDLAPFFLSLMDKYPPSLAQYPDEFAPYLARESAYPPRVLDTTGRPNRAMCYDVSSVGGYSGNVLARYAKAMHFAEGTDENVPTAFFSPRHLGETYQWMAVQYVICRPSEVPGGVEILARGKDQVLFKYPIFHPRFFLADRVTSATEPEKILAQMLMDPRNVTTQPVFENFTDRFESVLLGSEERVKLVSFSPNRVVLDVEAKDEPNIVRFLVVNEMYSKDWSASVNGKKVNIYPTNYLFRGIVVPGGRSRVVFEYRSVSFRIGATLTGISICILAALMTFARMPRQRKTPTSVS